MKLPLAYYGSPSLRKKANLVENLTDEIQQLIDDMIETMHAGNGIGLAATQVNREEAIFITCVPEQRSNGEWMEGVDRVYINPKILSYSDETIEWEEGCMSIPGVYLKIRRPKKIVIEAMDREGKRFQQELTGLFACNFCHENDHLNGVLHIDRLDRKTKERIKPKLQEIKKKHHQQTIAT